MAKVNSPIKIGSFTLKNRITFAPTVKFDFTDDSGCANEKLVQHYVERTKAGCDYLQVSNGLTSLESLPAFDDPKVRDIQSLGAYFHTHFKERVPVSCVGGLTEPGQITYLLENDYVDTVDVARAILADPEFANAVVSETEFVRCFGCKRCQYGPFTEHKCPAELKRLA